MTIMYIGDLKSEIYWALLSFKFRQTLVNLVDVDSKELISAWIITTFSTTPQALITYDIELIPNKNVMKKVLFKNQWNNSRKFRLVSSADSIMQAR